MRGGGWVGWSWGGIEELGKGWGARKDGRGGLLRAMECF